MNWKRLSSLCARCLKEPRNRVRRYANHPDPWYPDWSLRYRPLLRDLALHGRPPRRILEIGSNLFGLSMFLREPIISIDLAFAGLTHDAVRRGRPIAGSVTSLPVRSATVDQVVCIDTFEHLAPEDRPSATRELLRVLKPGGRAWIAFPCGQRAELFDKVLWREVKRRGWTVDWLDEHMQHQFPTAPEFREGYRSAITSLGYEANLSESKHASLPYHFAHIRLLLDAKNSGANLYLRALLKALVPFLSRVTLGPCYRRVFIVERLH